MAVFGHDRKGIAQSSNGLSSGSIRFLLTAVNVVIGTIADERKFYGYIIGVSLERSSDDLMADVPIRMFAMFEYNNEKSVYEVPDIALFEILTSHLLNNARMRADHGDYGYAKLWIEKTPGGWDVRPALVRIQLKPSSTGLA